MFKLKWNTVTYWSIFMQENEACCIMLYLSPVCWTLNGIFRLPRFVFGWEPAQFLVGWLSWQWTSKSTPHLQDGPSYQLRSYRVFPFHSAEKRGCHITPGKTHRPLAIYRGSKTPYNWGWAVPIGPWRIQVLLLGLESAGKSTFLWLSEHPTTEILPVPMLKWCHGTGNDVIQRSGFLVMREDMKYVSKTLPKKYTPWMKSGSLMYDIYNIKNNHV